VNQVQSQSQQTVGVPIGPGLPDQGADRITEIGDVRVTEAGDKRVTE
jgi:hypothetical protein